MPEQPVSARNVEKEERFQQANEANSADLRENKSVLP
jgi:hypothetical protein